MVEREGLPVCGSRKRRLHDAVPALVRRNSSPAQRSSLISIRPAAGGFSVLRRTSVMIGMFFLFPPQPPGGPGFVPPRLFGATLGGQGPPPVADPLASVPSKRTFQKSQ